MKGLLLKQWYQVRNQTGIFLLTFAFLIAYIFKPDNIIVRLLPLFLIMDLCERCYTRDETSGWLSYQITLPVRNRTIVGSYYIIYILMMSVSFVLQLGCLLFMEQKDVQLIRLLETLALIMIQHALTFYQSVRFGLAYAVPAMVVSVGIIGVIIFSVRFLSMYLSATIPILKSVPLAEIIMLVIAFLAEYLSYRASVRLYDKKRIKI